MSLQQRANQDFERANLRAFFRNVLARMTGTNNELLPFDEVRERLPIRGQHTIGLQQVSIDNIVGSLGRYHDFDRAFLPTQTRTRDRWVSIDRAHYQEIPLPPVELIKIGEIYFVRDGNHRVSVARERGQFFIDAYVTEIDVPVAITRDTGLKDLDRKKAYAEFLLQIGFKEARPGANLELTVPELYPVMLQHIAVHRWYLGEQRKSEVSWEEAVASWYDHVYLPLVQVLREQGVLDEFPGSSEADLYLWVMEYQGYLRDAYRDEPPGVEDDVRTDVTRRFLADYPQPAVRKLINVLSRASWLDNLLLNQERALFMDATQIEKIRPEAHLETTMPGQYNRLREHIAVHRYYLGEQRSQEVSYQEAVASWYDNVYLPLIEIIRQQKVMDDFPGRTETDLYLWIIEHQQHLREAYGSDVPLEQAAEKFTNVHRRNPFRKLAKMIKKLIGQT